MAKVGFGKAVSLGWVVIDKSSGAPKVVRKVSSIEDLVQDHLVKLASGNDCLTDQLRQEYKKRKLIQEMQVELLLKYCCSKSTFSF